MKVTIITVTYNSEECIEQCILSVLNQTYSNIEYVIIDGKSKDNTVNVIRKYSENISYWISETDRGMYDAINKGIEVSSGDIIGLLNSDDLFYSNDVVESIVNTFQSNQVDSVYGDLEYVFSDNINKVYRIWKGKYFKRSRFLFGWMPAHPTFYVKRNIYMKFGGYENHFHSAADYELMCRYLYKHKLSSFYLPKLIVKMRKGGQSNNNLMMRLRANRRDYLAMRKNGIPFAFFVSILKPLSKLHQYYKI